MPEESALVGLRNIGGTFLVPAYQRGYRWDTNQVTNLLDDFLDFADSNRKTFFLQPLVVSLVDRGNDNGPIYELIDGQQRLTTLFLFEAVLRRQLEWGKKQLNFNIIYSTRPESEAFLNKLATTPDMEVNQAVKSCMDFYFMHGACKTMFDWLSTGERLNRVSYFHGRLLDGVKFLWHDTTSETDTTPEQRFARLNSGRIALTDGELSRSLLLMPDNHDIGNELPEQEPASDDLKILYGRKKNEVITRRRALLAHDWDEMERLLRNESFWEFLGAKRSDMPTRVDYLLELHLGVQSSSPVDYVCFNKLFNQLKTRMTAGSPNDKDAQKIWEDIRKDMERLRFWYEDNDYYHHIGYLNEIYGQEKLIFLMRQAAKLSEKDFKELVYDQIRQSISTETPDLDEIGYNTPTIAQRILLLFNVEYTRKSPLRQGRFPFGLYRSQENSLEHVLARNVEALRENVDRERWIKDHHGLLQDFNYYDLVKNLEEDDLPDEDKFEEQKDELLRRCEHILKKFENARKNKKAEGLAEDFSSLSEELSAFVENYDLGEDSDSIFNLALIGKNINSALNNSTFAVKQDKLRKIQANENEFVPPATLALFMRHFTHGRCSAPWWCEEDRQGYRDKLLASLSEFWSSLGKLNTDNEKNDHE